MEGTTELLRRRRTPWRIHYRGCHRWGRWTVDRLSGSDVPERTNGCIASVGTGNSGDWASRAKVLDIAGAPGTILPVAVLVPVRLPSSSLIFTGLAPQTTQYPVSGDAPRWTSIPPESQRASGSYPVHVGSGALELLVDVVIGATPSGRCAVISDATVDRLWGDHVEGLLAGGVIDVVRLTFPPGEAHKTRDTWSVLTDGMIGAGLGRDCCVVALGGGVVGDVAGFVAATYMRGIPFIQVPTTTLAMIDASVGGKTGVDHSQGKNLVGVCLCARGSVGRSGGALHSGPGPQGSGVCRGHQTRCPGRSTLP